MDNNFRKEFEALKEKLEKINKLVVEKRKTIDPANTAEVKKFNALADTTKKTAEKEITKFGKKHNASAKTIKALGLALATSLTLSGCVGLIPGHDDSYDPTETTTPSKDGVVTADPGIYKSKDGKMIIVQDGKAYTMRKNENGETIKEQVEMPTDIETVVSTPNEKIVSYAENANGSTIISKNNVTKVTNITFTDAKTGITVTGKQQELVLEDDGRVTLNGAKLDGKGNAVVNYHSGKPTIEYAEIETTPDTYTYTDGRYHATHTIDFADIMKDTFDASGFGYLMSTYCPYKTDRELDSAISERIRELRSKGVSTAEELAMCVINNYLQIFLDSKMTISDKNGKQLAAIQSAGNPAKFLYINDELVPYMGFDGQSGQFVTFASGQDVYNLGRYESDTMTDKYYNIYYDLQQEFCNIFYGLMPTDNSFNIDGKNVTYVARNGSIIKYTAPQMLDTSQFDYGNIENNKFEIITQNGENFVIKFELIKEETNPRDLLYKTAMERKEKIDASAVSELSLN